MKARGKESIPMRVRIGRVSSANSNILLYRSIFIVAPTLLFLELLDQILPIIDT